MNKLQEQLLDLITLMPDSQTKEIIDYILGLKAGRRMRDANTDAERLRRGTDADEIRARFNDYWKQRGF